MRDKLLKLGIGSLLFAPGLAGAANPGACSTPQAQGLRAVSGAGNCGASGLSGGVSKIIDTLFIVVGSITVIIMIIGGIRYITSTGDASRIKAAKDTILYAIVGLIVVILARVIVGFVIGQIA